MAWYEDCLKLPAALRFSYETDAHRPELALEAGMLLLIEAGETHEIRNDGAEDLVTANVYSPPEYDEG